MFGQCRLLSDKSGVEQARHLPPSLDMPHSGQAQSRSHLSLPLNLVPHSQGPVQMLLLGTARTLDSDTASCPSAPVDLADLQVC